jgi:hypothetical protein
MQGRTRRIFTSRSRKPEARRFIGDDVHDFRRVAAATASSAASGSRRW